MRTCFEFNEEELKELLALKPAERKIWIGGILFTVNFTPIEKNVIRHGMFVAENESAPICAIKLDSNNIKAESIKDINCSYCTSRLIDFLRSKGMKW